MQESYPDPACGKPADVAAVKVLLAFLKAENRELSTDD
jgi:hypothetical protein